MALVSGILRGTTLIKEVSMAYPQPSGSFLHATLYSSLLLQVSHELFPAQPFFDLSPDKRRIVDTETGNLLLQAKWKVDSQGFAEFFAQQMPPQAGGNEAPAGTILGEKPPEPKRPGQYA
jgi:hypothetical protein